MGGPIAKSAPPSNIMPARRKAWKGMGQEGGNIRRGCIRQKFTTQAFFPKEKLHTRIFLLQYTPPPVVGGKRTPSKKFFSAPPPEVTPDLKIQKKREWDFWSWCNKRFRKTHHLSAIQ